MIHASVHSWRKAISPTQGGQPCRSAGSAWTPWLQAALRVEKGAADAHDCCQWLNLRRRSSSSGCSGRRAASARRTATAGSPIASSCWASWFDGGRCAAGSPIASGCWTSWFDGGRCAAAGQRAVAACRRAACSTASALLADSGKLRKKAFFEGKK